MFSHFLRVLLVWICLYLFLIKRASHCFASTKRFELFVCEVCFQFRKPDTKILNYDSWREKPSVAWFVRSSANKQPPSITTCSSSMDPCFFRGKGRKLFSNSFSKKDDGSGLQFHFSMNHPFFFLPRVEKKVATTKERLRLKDSMRIKMKAGKARPDI